MPLIDIEFAEKQLQNARALVNTRYDTPRGAGKQYDQWDQQIKDLQNLFETKMTSQQHVMLGIRAQLVTWAQTSPDLMAKEVFWALPVLAQRGLIEILNRLYQVLEPLMAENECEKALFPLPPVDQLVQMDTLEMVHHCTTRSHQDTRTLEELSSDAKNPRYFAPLDLPHSIPRHPNEANIQWPRHPQPVPSPVTPRSARLRIADLIHPPEQHQQNSLGTEPRMGIGHRAARHYGVNAADWNLRARRRWDLQEKDS